MTSVTDGKWDKALAVTAKWARSRGTWKSTKEGIATLAKVKLDEIEAAHSSPRAMCAYEYLLLGRPDNRLTQRLWNLCMGEHSAYRVREQSCRRDIRNRMVLYRIELFGHYQAQMVESISHEDMTAAVAKLAQVFAELPKKVQQDLWHKATEQVNRPKHYFMKDCDYPTTYADADTLRQAIDVMAEGYRQCGQLYMWLQQLQFINDKGLTKWMV